MEITEQKVAVYGFILNEANELLVIKRAAHDTHPNLWELPGGAVDLGEDPQHAVLREISEEAGLEVKILYPLIVINRHSTTNKGMQVIRVVYLCHTVEILSSLLLGPDHSEYRWIVLDDLPPLDYSDIFTEAYKKIKEHPLLVLNR